MALASDSSANTAISYDDGSSNWALVTQGKDLDGDHGTWLGPNLVLAIAGIGVVDQHIGVLFCFCLSVSQIKLKQETTSQEVPPGSNKMHKFEKHFSPRGLRASPAEMALSHWAHVETSALT